MSARRTRFARLLAGVMAAALAAHGPQAGAQETAASDPADHQDHADHAMMPMPPSDAATPAVPTPEHDMAGMDMAGHAEHAGDGAVADQPGTAPAPPVPRDHAADAVFAADVMAASRAALYRGAGFSTFALQIDRLEYRTTGSGKGGFGWEGQAWYGGDIDRIVLDSTGEGSFGERAERLELATYWRHALDPWYNLEVGVRHDFRTGSGSGPQRTYALVGIEGLAPYWFEIEAQMLVSEQGDVHTRATIGNDQRLTQNLVLEPEAEFDFAYQDVPEIGVGAGFERIELGARLRYDANRALAPYVGINWERKLAGTARYARLAGEDPAQLTAVVGIRALF
ncbi:copper resistance protein B [Novosphingobium sp. 1949]|uniref:Copper resistance protein B n=1 Tax=Novosphingobium organovorum TaxID=2930092 RepID=A0ABT0BHA1_9SPHN|nr:copper resistance protein B [Novosphingobium organovorum]MCJ2184400.1 copper resistance protein B [Novosphingobium organovorum]